MWEAGIGPCTRVTSSAVEQILKRLLYPCATSLRFPLVLTLVILALPPSLPQSSRSTEPTTPPRVLAARRFLQRRNWPSPLRSRPSSVRANSVIKPQSAWASTAVWQPLGPTAVLTPNYGLVTGRVSSIAIDPADPSGNHVYIGSTGGGVWVSQNAASSSNIVFSPLTEALPAFDNTWLTSISIGAVTVQPGGTGVILAGTGDTNDALDSYYGAGTLRSTDGGTTWTAISGTSDRIYSFSGEGFSGFAWSTISPQLVVAAVAQSYEGTLVNAAPQNASYAGLYYSTDAGATWSLARITDGPGQDIQGPSVILAKPNGNSATAVVWNPVRKLFIAAVRFHGYYQSSDGITWTRMALQPGSGITTDICPPNRGAIGSIACPVFRGSLAVNPLTGDTFAWTVDLYNQDQGLWQDTCSLAGGNCSNQSIAFAQRWTTLPLETNTALGPSTIANGDYTLTLAAVPSGQDTVLLAAAKDLWRCSLAMGCTWRNTTNAETCMSGQVAPYQHSLAWNPSNPQEILIGNDSGLWRSMDGVAESGSVCSADDATHFQNLNAALGSLAEVDDISQVGETPYTMMASLGVNGTAGVKGKTGPTNMWPQIIGGEGGPVAIDPVTPSNWYVNTSAGVSIYRCSDAENCTPNAFGSVPVVDNADVAGDGYTMITPAPFIIDPLDHSQILVGTCRLWRGPSDGTPWTTANAISPFLDGVAAHPYCSGDSFIHSIAAMPVSGGKEVIYIGMSGYLNGGSIVAGHLLKAVFSPGDAAPASWADLTFNPVENHDVSFNHFGFDISSIFINPHDTTGDTVYVTIPGIRDSLTSVAKVYRSTDGGTHWYQLDSNLPVAPANAIVIDPQDANTAYVATDAGVYFTQNVSACVDATTICWSAFGTGLPNAPVTKLSAAPPSTSPNVLVAATYGRGIWQIPLATAGLQLTTTSVDPTSLTFPSLPVGTVSSPQTLTITNQGGIALAVKSVTVQAPFSETDTCVGAIINSGAGCTISLRFAPDQIGPESGTLAINANVPGGQLLIPVSGAGLAAGIVTASPGNLDFGSVAVGSTSTLLPVTIENSGSNSVALTSVTATAPFSVAANPCGSSLVGHSACSISIAFTPTAPGTIDGTLSITDSAGIQTVALAGLGAAKATDSLSGSSLQFPETVVGQLSSFQFITLSNDGDLPLIDISVSASPGFRASTTCSGSLGAHASCAISAAFAPTAEGAASGTVTVSDALRSQMISVSGTGLKAPEITVSPAQINFPPVIRGQSSSPATLTVTNTGGAPMANLNFQLTGPLISSFSLTGSTCGPTLANGNNCSIKITFTPSSVGQLNATLSVSSSTNGVSAVQVPISGIGQGTSGLTISPPQMNFTQRKLGEATGTQIATISNTSATTATNLSLSASLPFSLTENTCGSTLSAGASCSTGVIFTPVANAQVTRSLTVSSSAFSDPAVATLVGTGGAAGSLQLQPGSITFPTTGVGSTSSPQAVKLTNNGPVPLLGLKLSVSVGFKIDSTTCAASLDVAANCTVQIEFAPTNAGQQTGDLDIASDSLPTSARVALSGTGFDFTVSVAGQASKTVSSGQTASYSLTLSPMNGSAATFTFSCSSLPANSTCSFNPANEAIQSNSTGTVTVSVATGNTARASSMPAQLPRVFRALPVACFVILPLFVRRKRRILLVRIATAVVLIGISACAGAGGGGGGAPVKPSGGTPPGTYSLVVTSVANGVSHKTTLTLIVD